MDGDDSVQRGTFFNQSLSIQGTEEASEEKSKQPHTQTFDGNVNVPKKCPERK